MCINIARVASACSIICNYAYSFFFKKKEAGEFFVVVAVMLTGFFNMIP
jgi:hypothetical protein